ncbi:hypothetical protein HRbin34_00282 [bacterium HR34]|nr:hypothetical protein HRbin34_00282 [bacterium HR34]
MEIAVYDTYVKRKDGRIMHFDIIVEKNTPYEKVIAYGNEYLKTKGEEGQELSSNECKFCHIEKASKDIEEKIKNKGYYIYEMENC